MVEQTLFILACGDRVTISRDWTFGLYLESRNVQFAKERGLLDKAPQYGGVWEGEPYRSQHKRVECTIASGTTLQVDRVYIRQFSKAQTEVETDYDSITWRVMKGNKPAPRQRFWCKLPDVYLIRFNTAPDLYRDRVKAVRSVLGQ